MIIALPLALALAAQPAAPAEAVPDARVHVRGELPRVHLAVAVPVDRPTIEHALLAALLSEPRALPGGEVAALRARSGRLDVALVPDGLVLTAEGDARDAELVLAAARAALFDDAAFDAAGLVPARARALVRLAHRVDDDAGRARAELGRLWFGERSPFDRPRFDEVQLLRTPLAAATSARVALADARSRSRWFVEGRVAPSVLAGLPAPADPADPSAVALQPAGDAAAPARVLSQPLPPTARTDALAPALLQWMRAALAERASSVRIVRGRGVRLLVVELADGVAPADARASLIDARAGLKRARDVRDAVDVGRAQEARAAARLGAWAARRARFSLIGARLPALDDERETEEALFDLVRRVVLPEIMRPSKARAVSRS